MELDLQAFGPFTDVKLDLSQGQEGVHVVYGPNEAGKSSALRAMHAVLFGIPHQCRDAFLHDYRSLRIGARLRNQSGETLSIVRRKGRSETLLNPDHPQEAAYPDQTLDPFLGGVEGATFERVFGIDHDELLRGGEQMRALKGLVGESLFAASLGGVGLAQVLSELDAEAGELYGKKRNSAVKQGIREYQETLKEKRDAEVSSNRWQTLQRELQQAADERDQVTGRLNDLRIQVSRLDRLRKALKWIGERTRLRQEIEELGDVVVLPESYSATDRSHCQVELAHVRQRIETLKAELDGDEGLRAQIAAIELPEGLLEHEETIAAVRGRMNVHLKAMHDLSTNVQVRRDELLAQTRSLLRDLGIELTPSQDDAHSEPADKGHSDWQQVEELRIPSDRRVAIQNLGSDEKRLRNQPVQIARQKREVDQTLAAAIDELEQLGTVRDTSELQRLCERIRKQGDWEADLNKRRQAVQSLQAQAESALAALGLWNGTLANMAAMAVPLRETVDRFDRELAAIDEDLKRCQRTETEITQELFDLQQEIARLQETERLPTEEDLDAARQRRERGWKLIRRAWLQDAADEQAEREFAGETPLADAYEQSVAHADQTADRLRREADRVAHMAERLARQTQLEQRLQSVRNELEQTRQRQAQWQADWCRQWSPIGVSEPLSPREMRGWLQQFAELKQTVGTLEQQQRELDELVDRCWTFCGQLRSALVPFADAEPSDHQPVSDVDTAQSSPHPDAAEQNSAADVSEVHPVPSEDRPAPADLADTLNQLIDRADAAIRHQHNRNQRRQELEREIQRWQREREKLRAAEQEAVEEFEAWQQQWREAMRLIGCPDDASAQQANERMSQLEQLFKHVDQLEELDARIRGIQQDARDFQTEVRALAERLAPDLLDVPAVQAAGELQARLDAARQDKVRLDQLQQLAEKSQSELTQASRREREVTTQLDQLCRLAGVEHDESLPEIESYSEEVTVRRQRLHEIEDQLLHLGDGLSVQQLVAEAEGRDADELQAQIDQLQDEIKELEQQRDQAVARVRELENESRAVDGSAQAADADERALGILSRVYTDTENYLKLRLAASILRHQIEKYRAENQDPLLNRASDLFARITCGEFAGLKTEYDAADQPIIVGIRHNDERVPVEGMSEGTRDQLYLSLRLGYLERRLSRHEPQPFIVDDILIQFDDDRAGATLQVLSEISRQTQVVFFTHHKHLVELAESRLADDSLFVHTLSAAHRASALAQ